MTEENLRGRFLRGTLASAIVVGGFDLVLRSWMSAAELDDHAAALAEDFADFASELTFGPFTIPY